MDALTRAEAAFAAAGDELTEAEARRDEALRGRWALEERVRVYGDSGATPQFVPGGRPFIGKSPSDPVGLGLAEALQDTTERLTKLEVEVTEAHRRRNRAERDITAIRAAIRRAAKQPAINEATRDREAAKAAAARAVDERRAAIRAELQGGSTFSAKLARLVGRP